MNVLGQSVMGVFSSNPYSPAVTRREVLKAASIWMATEMDWFSERKNGVRRLKLPYS